MYFSMIQDKKWILKANGCQLRRTGGGGGGQVSVTEGMRFSTVFIETGSGQHVCLLRAVIPSQERGCVSGFLRLSCAEPRVLSLKYKDFPW